MPAAWPIDPNAHDFFVLRQRIRPVVNQYEFSLPDASGSPGQVFCFVEQRRFTFKEDIRFYADDSKGRELMRLKARQRFDPRARYDVTGADDEKIGEIQKVFGASLLRSSYALFDAGGAKVATAREQNLPIALFRRGVSFMPFVGDYADWLPIPYNFVFTDGDRVLGIHRRVLGKFRDVYQIDLSPDSEHRLDRRLILAIAVGMDALQAR